VNVSPHSIEHDSNRPIVVLAAVVLVAAIAVGGLYLRRAYVESSLRDLGWSAGTPQKNGVLKCFPNSRDRFAWPLRYKPEWTDLYIRGCTITVRDANDLADASQIESLHLSCSIEPGAFAPLARLPRLASIRLSGPRFSFSPADLRDLRASKSLKELYVVGGGSCEELVQALSEIASLERITIRAFVTAEEIEPLTRLPNLRFLAIGALKASPGLVPIFKRMNRLEELSIMDDLRLVSPAGAIELSKALPNLRILPERFAPRSVRSPR
jgi:hypothetical protein